MRGWLLRSRARWAPGRLDELQQLIDETPLHPTDHSTLDLALRRARHFPGDLGCRASLIEAVSEAAARYRHPYDPMHGLVVDQIRATVPRQRGRSVSGKHGDFRRGDAVCLPQGRTILDGVLLEVEPSSEHATRFGRMAGVQLLSDQSLTRWFLDELHHGRDYGRPW